MGVPSPTCGSAKDPSFVDTRQRALWLNHHQEIERRKEQEGEKAHAFCVRYFEVEDQKERKAVAAAEKVAAAERKDASKKRKVVQEEDKRTFDTKVAEVRAASILHLGPYQPDDVRCGVCLSWYGAWVSMEVDVAWKGCKSCDQWWCGQCVGPRR